MRPARGARLPRLARRARAAGAGIALLALGGCKQDTYSNTPPPAAQVSGMWRGSFGPQSTPLGTLVFVFLPDEETGRVGGSVSFGGNECLATHGFEGRISGLAMEGRVADEAVELRFEFDLRQAENPDSPRIQGIFEVVLAEGCQGFRQPFRATPEQLPLVADDGPAGGSGWLGAWVGAWRPDAHQGAPLAPEPLLLLLDEDAGGGIGGALLLRGEILPFAGCASGPVLCGLARNGELELQLVAHAQAGDARAPTRLHGRLLSGDGRGLFLAGAGELALQLQERSALCSRR